MNFRRILIAIDGSPIAAHAADVGIELALLLGAELSLIYVVDPGQTWTPEAGASAAELIKLEEKEGKRLLAEFRCRATLKAPPFEFIQIGRPADEIVKAAKEWHSDIIVIGSHGRSGIGRVLLGSVAEGVMRQTRCPVLVVRSDD